MMMRRTYWHTDDDDDDGDGDEDDGDDLLIDNAPVCPRHTAAPPVAPTRTSFGCRRLSLHSDAMCLHLILIEEGNIEEIF